jgi:hypothetical protein
VVTEVTGTKPITVLIGTNSYSPHSKGPIIASLLYKSLFACPFCTPLLDHYAEAMSITQNSIQCPNIWLHNCVSTLRKFNCCCFVFVPSILRWHRSAVRETWNRTERFLSLQTGEGIRESSRKQLNSKDAKMFHRCLQNCCRFVARHRVSVSFQFC